MAQRVTLQDIADELGLSRNTISKAINNTGVLAESTRARVLRKAQEMGYKQFSYMEFKENMGSELRPAFLAPASSRNEVVILMAGLVSSSHFASPMLESMQQELSELGYSMSMYSIMPEELNSLQLPGALDLDNTAAIVCVELFSAPYCRMLAKLKIPLLMIDGPVTILEGTIPADQLMMDNQKNLYAFAAEMKRRGRSRIGFIGDFRHCQSFYERYIAFRQAVDLYGLKDTGTITGITVRMEREEYLSVLRTSISSVKEWPDVYICANDFIAIDVLRVLHSLDIQVPDDLWLCGFDNSPEARIVTPQLTTIRIHGRSIGHVAVNLILSRISSPESDYRTVYVSTDLIFRKSTGD